MGTLYILKSLKNGSYYVGSTNNIKRRLIEHNNGKTRSLKFLRPLQLVFKKDYSTLEEARKMEYKLKKAKSKIILERIIHDQEITMGQ